MAPRTVEPAAAAVDAADGEELLRLALSLPREALQMSRAVLADGPDDRTRSYALQAAGVASREMGEGADALRFIRRALRAAERSGRDDRVADVTATLGATLAQAGRTDDALVALDRAVALAHGVDAARCRVRRGAVLQLLGRHDAALVDLRRAIPVLRRSDPVYEARALAFRAFTYDDLGDFARSDRDLARSEMLMLAAGQQFESAMARNNRGHVAYRAGELPTALRHYDATEQLLRGLAMPYPDLELDRCRLLLAAGLPEDARTRALVAADLLSGDTAHTNLRAEALLSAASAGLAAGDPHQAVTDAHAAFLLFRRQQRRRWAFRAQRVELLARWSTGEATRSMQDAAAAVADGLRALRDSEVTEAELLAGRIAVALGHSSDARRHLGQAARARTHGSAISRVTGWLASALIAQANGDTRRLLTACRKGLDVVDEHRLTLGATEMRARATVHGAELSAIATRHAAGARDAQQLLLWSERWRATTLTAAPVRPPDDDELARELAALRDVVSRIGDARGKGTSTVSLEHEQTRLEFAVRQRMLRTSGSGAGRPVERLDINGLKSALGDTTLLELVEVDGTLHAVTVTARRTTMHTVGPVDAALSELEFALFALRRIAAATSPALIRASARSLDAAASALEQTLLGPVTDRLGDGPVLVVPSGRLHAAPWSLLTCLRDREVTVAPSATSWLRARAMHPPRRHKVALVAGPGLETGGAEVAKVADFYPDAQLLEGPAATADDVLDALNGASLAHIAAHGTFRADNALFSSLRLADGPLTVHDLERLRRPPHRLLLSSCDSGLGEVAGADELLGLSSALIGMGSAGLLASVVQVNDPATVPLMIAVHEQLQHGATLAQALHRARMSLDATDPVLTATGQSFIALGAA